MCQRSEAYLWELTWSNRESQLKEKLAAAGIVHPTCGNTTIAPELVGKKTLAQTVTDEGRVVAGSYAAVHSGVETINFTCTKTAGCTYSNGQSGTFKWDIYVLDQVDANYSEEQGGLVVTGLSEYSSYSIYKVLSTEPEELELVKEFDASELTFRDLTNNTNYTITSRDKAIPESAESAPTTIRTPATTKLTIEELSVTSYRQLWAPKRPHPVYLRICGGCLPKAENMR